MKRLKICALTAVAMTVLTGTQVMANLFANPGFESPITSDGPPFVGSWEGFQGGGASSANSSTTPRTGTMDVNLTINNTPNTFAGVFQDIPNLTPGTLAKFSGWNRTPSNPLSLVSEVRIEWRNSVSDTEISRTPNLNPVATSDYTPFTLFSTVPAGANTARAVYAIQSFSTNPLGNGTVFIDDFNFVIPEPATLSLCGLAIVPFVGMRRKRW